VIRRTLGRVQLDRFEAVLLAILAIVVAAVALFCSPVLADDTAIIQQTVNTVGTPAIRPVSRVVNFVYVPTPKRGYIWNYTPLTVSEMEKLAAVYESPDGWEIPQSDASRIRRVLLLVASGAGKDRDLQTFLYYLAFRHNEPHPLRGVLEQKKVLDFKQLDADSKEGIEFLAKLEETAARYGLK
jgi:hypothetical protein